MARKKLKRRKPLASEFVVYRDRKGRIRKFRQDLLLIGEIRSRKTGKILATLNRVDKKGKPSPQRFKPVQRAIAEATSQPHKKRKLLDSFTFTVYSTEFIKEQIPSEIVLRINAIRKRVKKLILKIFISFPTTDVNRNISIAYSQTLSAESFEGFIAVHIAGMYRDLHVRFSPKLNKEALKKGKVRQTDKERRRKREKEMQVTIEIYKA